uniref:Uncharacterized protein n=1 Tax=Siphoviridae sp. ctLdn10 TaxID=2827847 RepID=A0A8S5SQR1_9CAUD|nr:MAG TPA: hypothetical protein [Siphoviridae sp. ctLdn10]
MFDGIPLCLPSRFSFLVIVFVFKLNSNSIRFKEEGGLLKITPIYHKSYYANSRRSAL